MEPPVFGMWMNETGSDWGSETTAKWTPFWFSWQEAGKRHGSGLQDRQRRHRQGIERRVTDTDTATYTGAETLDLAAILVPLRGKMTYGTNLA